MTKRLNKLNFDAKTNDPEFGLVGGLELVGGMLVCWLRLFQVGIASFLPKMGRGFAVSFHWQPSLGTC